MINPLLWPGDKIAAMTGLPEGSDNRQILRMWINTVIWGVVCTLILVWLLA